MTALSDLFDTSGGNSYTNPEASPNHGKHWTLEHTEILYRTFLLGANLEKCCVVLGRTRCSILNKLKEEHLVALKNSSSYYGPYVYTAKAKRLAIGQQVDAAQPFISTTVTERIVSDTPAMQQFPRLSVAKVDPDVLARLNRVDYGALKLRANARGFVSDDKIPYPEKLRCHYPFRDETMQTPVHDDWYDYLYSLPPTPKEKTMSATIETRTFINGSDAMGMTDEQIFKLIRSEEVAIEELKKTKTMPKKLSAKIEAMEKAIAALVKYVDERP